MRGRHQWAKAAISSLACLPSAVFAASSAVDALRNVQPAPHFCPRPEAANVQGAAAMSAEFGQPLPAPDWSCATVAARAAEFARRPGTVIVDTRPVADFNRFHIDGAVNLAAAAVRTKSFLLRHALVLVGSGKGERALYSQCAQLRTGGNVQTYVLQGGMSAWLLEQRPVVGTPPAMSEMLTLSPAELFVEASSRSSRFVLLRGAMAIKDELPAATVLGSGHLDTGLIAIKSTLAAKVAAEPVSSIVVLADGGVTAADMVSASALLRPRPVLFYLGDAKSYSKFVAAQKSVWAAHARGPKVPPCSLR